MHRKYFVILVGFTLLVASCLRSPGQTLRPSGVATPTAPANDDQTNAALITTLPFTNILDTSLATAASNDPNCLGPEATVWYKFIPARDLFVAMDTAGSDYATMVTPAILQDGQVRNYFCGVLYTSFQASAHHTYYLSVGSLFRDYGGHLELHVTADPALKLNVNIDPVVVPNRKTGKIMVFGSLKSNRYAQIGLFGFLIKDHTKPIDAPIAFELPFLLNGRTNWQAEIDPSLLLPHDQNRLSLQAYGWDPQYDLDAQTERTFLLLPRKNR